MSEEIKVSESGEVDINQFIDSNHFFMGNAGRVVAVSMLVGFMLIGPAKVIAAAQENSLGKNEEISYIVELPDNSYLAAQNSWCIMFNSGDCEENCTIDIDWSCESVQVPCAYGIYLPNS